MTGDVDVRFDSAEFERALNERFDEETGEILGLSAQLCSIPGVSVPASGAAFDQLIRSCAVVREYAESKGLRVYQRAPEPDHPYPFLIVTFRENDLASTDFAEAVTLIGHLDVVPARDEGQFSPFLRGVDLYARGAADMKTVVSTFLAWMARLQQRPGPKPPFLLLLSCCEENGSHRPHHARSIVEWLRQEHQVTVRFGLVGERTGELEWMGQRLAVGPVCTENRSWRWFRLSSPSACGKPALARMAGVVKRCRLAVAELNLGIGDSRRRQQPDLRSGFLNPFAFVAGAREVDGHGEAVTLTASRPAGSSFHSAVANAAQASLLEIFNDLAAEADGLFGRENVHLAGVRIGEEGNFNTSDGSGEMHLVLGGIRPGWVGQWIAGRERDDGVTLAVRDGSTTLLRKPTAAGLDIRELLDHRERIAELMAILGEDLSGGEELDVVHNLPSWRCPPGHPDLSKLLEAYEAVTGEPSRQLVKLHGNDGGNLVAWQHAVDSELAARGEGHAVIFGQVGMNPHGPREFHRGTSIRPYLDILDKWAASYVPASV